MGRERGGCLTAVVAALAVALLVLGAGLLYLVSISGEPEPPSATPDSEPASFAEYSWQELSELSALVASAPSDEEGRAIAAQHGVEVGDARTVTLDDGNIVEVRVIGIRHDERADGSGVAGITLMASPVSVRRLGSDPANEGGWAASDLCAWLAEDGLELLPDELAEVLVPVLKTTASRALALGDYDVASALEKTSETLWPLSVAEVCGSVTWMTDDFGTTPSAHTGYVDYAPYDELLSSEGTQYEYFSALGVGGSSGATSALVLSRSGSPCSWWLRTSYPFTYGTSTERLCYQVSSSGLPSALARATDEAGVAVGFCL